jgi:hypothetical protein
VDQAVLVIIASLKIDAGQGMAENLEYWEPKAERNLLSTDTCITDVETHNLDQRKQ